MNESMMKKLELLRSLELPEGEWAIFGSGIMAPLGIKEAHHDLDILARDSAWDKAMTLGEITQADMGDHVVELFDGQIEIFDNWKPGDWDCNELIDTAEMIDGFPWVRLEHVIEWKKRMGRVKDIKDMKLIEEYLKSQKVENSK